MALGLVSLGILWDHRRHQREQELDRCIQEAREGFELLKSANDLSLEDLNFPGDGEAADRITAGGVLHELRQAAPVVPPVIVASVAAITVPTAATGLLVVPGLWLLTRWSLFAPVISRQRPGPMEALRRSNSLVRNHFWLVFLTATLALILEETVIHVGAVVGLFITASDTWGEWAGDTIAASLITPLAALVTSVTYQRLATRGAFRRKDH